MADQTLECFPYIIVKFTCNASAFLVLSHPSRSTLLLRLDNNITLFPCILGEQRNHGGDREIAEWAGHV